MQRKRWGEREMGWGECVKNVGDKNGGATNRGKIGGKEPPMEKVMCEREKTNWFGRTHLRGGGC